MSEDSERLQGLLALAQGNACVAAGQYVEAEVHLRQAVALRVGGMLARFSMLRTHLARQDYAGARDVLRGWGKVPVGVMAGIDVLEGSGGSYIDAMAWVEEAVQKHPYFQFWAGLVTMGAGRSNEAEMHFRAFLALQPPYAPWEWAKMRWEKEEAQARLGALRSLPVECGSCTSKRALDLIEHGGRAGFLCGECQLLLLDEPLWRRFFRHEISDAVVRERLDRLASLIFGDELEGVRQELLGESGRDDDSERVYPQLEGDEVDLVFDAACQNILDQATQMATGRGCECTGTADILQALLQHTTSWNERLAFVEGEIDKALLDPEPCHGRYSVPAWRALSVARWNNVLSRHPAERASERHLMEGLVWADKGVAARLLRPRLLPEDRILSSALHLLLINSEQLKLFESMLREEPEDLYLHLVLLACESHARSIPHRAEHALWVMRHYPRYRLSTTSSSQLECRSPGGYVEAVALWVRYLQEYPDDPAILALAADIFFLSQDELAEVLLKRGSRMQPDTSEWAERLSHLYSLRMAHLGGDDRRQEARQALEIQEEVLGRMTDPNQRLASLPQTAKLALEAGEVERAERYSGEMLSLATVVPSNWATGNAIHHGHLVLGRVALERGDVATARAELLAAGGTPGSPQLNSFGPNMRLSYELLERGEKDVVLAYLVHCGSFWSGGQEALRGWRVEIEQGKTPDFGANMDY